MSVSIIVSNCAKTSWAGSPETIGSLDFNGWVTFQCLGNIDWLSDLLVNRGGAGRLNVKIIPTQLPRSRQHSRSVA